MATAKSYDAPRDAALSPHVGNAIGHSADHIRECAARYNGSKIRTKKHRDYVLGLRAKYATEYQRENTPPPKYDVPYTGKLTIERVADPTAVAAACPNLDTSVVGKVGCAKVAKDLSTCKVIIVSDAYLNKRPAETRKLFDQTYEAILRHELAHCNGWPGDHPH